MLEFGLACDVINARGQGFLQIVVGSHAGGAVRCVRRERTMIAPTARALDTTEWPGPWMGGRPTVRSTNCGLTRWNIFRRLLQQTPVFTRFERQRVRRSCGRIPFWNKDRKMHWQPRIAHLM